MKLKNITAAKRNRIIKHARTLVELRNNSKWDICRLALEICDFVKGRIPEGAYTITRFAEDIGMNRKTLSCWILDYRFASNAMDLSKPLSDKETKRINSAISKARLAVKGNTGQWTLTENEEQEVSSCVHKYLHEDDHTWKLRSFIRNSKHHLFFLKGLNKKKLKQADRALLKEYSGYIKEILEELTGRVK